MGEDCDISADWHFGFIINFLFNVNVSSAILIWRSGIDFGVHGRAALGAREGSR